MRTVNLIKTEKFIVIRSAALTSVPNFKLKTTKYLMSEIDIEVISEIISSNKDDIFPHQTTTGTSTSTLKMTIATQQHENDRDLVMTIIASQFPHTKNELLRCIRRR